MSFYKFDKKEILLNKVRSHPENLVYISGSNLYLNNSDSPGIKPINHVSGSVLGVARNSYDIRPIFVTPEEYNSTASLPSDIYYKNYYLSSSLNIASDFLTGATIVYPDPSDPSITTSDLVFPDPKLSALHTTLDSHIKNSIHYAFTASLGDYNWIKPEQENDCLLVFLLCCMAQESNRATVDLKFYYTGTLAAQLTDSNETGELIQTSLGTTTTGEGDVAGVILYDEGFLLLTGSWALNEDSMSPVTDNPRWKYFATQSVGAENTTFEIGFNGTSYTPVMTMFAHANRGELNSSNNPTFLVHSSSADGNDQLLVTGSYMYVENEKRNVQNVVSSSFQDTGSFEKTTYLSSIGIYDDNHNLVGIAKLANPIRKRGKRQLHV